MPGVNKVIILGRLGRDPDVRTLQSGGKVVSFSLATSETWKDKASGERQERTQWHRVVIWNEGLAGIAERFLKKGSEVYLEGQIETRKFEKDGIQREVTEVVLRQYRGELALIGGRSGGNEESAPRSPGTTRQAAPDDDEIPF